MGCQKLISNHQISTSKLSVVWSKTDYDFIPPFGMLMPGRHSTSESYRYSYQGQERDDEIKGAGNSYNYKYRMHDPRLGRFFAVDPLSSKYPYNSPYAFSENDVISHIELEGLEKATPKDKQKAVSYVENFFSINRNSKWSGATQDEYKQDLIDLINEPEEKLNQTGNTCGITSAIYLMAVYEPLLLAKMATDLYGYGHYVGDDYSIFTGPDEWDNGFPAGYNMAAVVLISSLRNNENSWFSGDYDPNQTDTRSSFTTPSEVSRIVTKLLGLAAQTCDINTNDENGGLTIAWVDIDDLKGDDKNIFPVWHYIVVKSIIYDKSTNTFTLQYWDSYSKDEDGKSGFSIIEGLSIDRLLEINWFESYNKKESERYGQIRGNNGSGSSNGETSSSDGGSDPPMFR